MHPRRAVPHLPADVWADSALSLYSRAPFMRAEGDRLLGSKVSPIFSGSRAPVKDAAAHVGDCRIPQKHLYISTALKPGLRLGCPRAAGGRGGVPRAVHAGGEQRGRSRRGRARDRGPPGQVAPVPRRWRARQHH